MKKFQDYIDASDKTPEGVQETMDVANTLIKEAKTDELLTVFSSRLKSRDSDKYNELVSIQHLRRSGNAISFRLQGTLSGYSGSYSFKED